MNAEIFCTVNRGMLKPRIAIIVLVSCLAIFGNSPGQSQGLIPNSGDYRQPEQAQPRSAEQPESAEQHVAADPHGTEQSPLIVKVLPPTDAPNNSVEVPQEGRSTTDWLLLMFIGLLVLVGAGQGVVFAIQARRLRDVLQSLMTGECALIYPIELNASLLLPNGEYANDPENPDAPLPAITCEFMNIGRTTGIIKEIRGELFFGTHFPREPAYAYSQVKRGDIMARPEKKTAEQRFEYSRNFTTGEIELIKERKVGVLFFGYVKYNDVFGRLHTKGFGLMCRGLNKFQAWGGRGYNYIRSEEAAEKNTPTAFQGPSMHSKY
jgi:hypothetical protein